MQIWKEKRWITLYAVALLLMIFVLAVIDVRLSEHAQQTFQMFPYIISMTIIYPLFGMLLGTSHILNEHKKRGKWKLNLGKILVIGLPAFFLSYYTVLVFSIDAPLHFLSIPGGFFNKMMLSGSTMHFFQILLGYTILTSFYKEERKDHLNVS